MTDEAFEAYWADEIARNGGVPIGADYRHWALRGWQAAIKQEREACIKEAEHWQKIGKNPEHKCGEYIAAAIRSRSSVSEP